jgi:dihydrolipoamide dehydrogenase
MSNYDVIVIGSGPGGYVAAIRAAHNGLKTAIVEKDTQLGGTCLLRGCIPTKSLLHSADLLDELRAAKGHGIVAGEVGFDFAGVQRARAKVVRKSAAGVAYLMKNNKIDVHTGWGRLAGGNTVEVMSDGDLRTLSTKHVILATGSVPKELPFLEVDGKRILTSNELLEMKKPPESLLVLGAGAVGVEFASIYSRFGSRCTVVEMLEHALPDEDVEIGVEFERLMKKRGVPILCGTRVERAEVRNQGVVTTVAGPDGPSELEAEVVLVAVGRAPYTEGLGLENVGLATERGFLDVNPFMQTAVPTIYAIGDVVPTPQLAHVASAEALVAADHIAGVATEPVKYPFTPSCTYSDPEVASVGLSERAAREQGYEVKTGKFPFSALGKARVMGNTDGFVKVVSDARYDEVLGVHIIGPRATDLIAEAVVALQLETTTEELARTMHAHPTLPEAVLEAVHATVHRPIHM